MSVHFVKKIRESKGLTRYALAKLLGVMPQTVDWWEDRASGRGYEMLVELRQIAGLSWDQMGEMLDKEFKKKKKS